MTQITQIKKRKKSASICVICGEINRMLQQADPSRADGLTNWMHPASSIEQGSRGAEEQGSRGAEEQGSRGAEGRGWSPFLLFPFSE
jgi:hypothetical protein